MNGDNKFDNYEYDKVAVQEKIHEKREVPKYGYGIRHIQLVIFLICLTVNFAARGHMGVTIVAMTNHPKLHTKDINTTVYDGVNNTGTVLGTELNKTDILDDILVNKSAIGDLIDADERKVITYDWPKSIHEMVLGSFFIGYCITMFPIGMVCQRWGGKLPLQLALFCNGIASILTPWLTIWGGWKAVCFCRILQGLTQSGTYPSIQTLLGKWVPASERATLSSYVYTGAAIGNVVAFQLGGYLGDSRWGWPATFWAVGGLCLICFVFLTLFGAATPLEHKTISEEEKNFILGSVGDQHVKKLKTPWREIIKSRPYWGTIFTQIGCTIGFVFYFNQVPSYIHYILGTNVKNSGFLTSLPYFICIFFSPAFGLISDYCTNNNIISIKNARRVSNSVSQCGMAFCLMLLSFTTNLTIAMTCLVIAMICNILLHTGWMVNHIDLAPNFSGTLMATGSTLATLISAFLPIPISLIITDVSNVIQWRIMFFIIAAILVVTNAVFVLLMSSETQPWNYVDSDDTCLEEQKPGNKH